MEMSQATKSTLPLGLAVYPDGAPEGVRLGVIGSFDTSAAGNVIMRCGNTSTDGGWTVDAHVVLTPDETRDLIGRLAVTLAEIEAR